MKKIISMSIVGIFSIIGLSSINADFTSDILQDSNNAKYQQTTKMVEGVTSKEEKEKIMIINGYLRDSNFIGKFDKNNVTGEELYLMNSNILSIQQIYKIEAKINEVKDEVVAFIRFEELNDKGSISKEDTAYVKKGLYLIEKLEERLENVDVKQIFNNVQKIKEYEKYLSGKYGALLHKINVGDKTKLLKIRNKLDTIITSIENKKSISEKELNKYLIIQGLSNTITTELKLTLK